MTFVLQACQLAPGSGELEIAQGPCVANHPHLHSVRLRQLSKQSHQPQAYKRRQASLYLHAQASSKSAVPACFQWLDGSLLLPLFCYTYRAKMCCWCLLLLRRSFAAAEYCVELALET